MSSSVCYVVTQLLTHWGRVTHICVGNLTIIGPDNGLSPGRRQAIIWTNAGILLIGPWGTNFSEISIGNHTFSFKKIHLKMSSSKWCPFCLGLNVFKTMKYQCWDKADHNHVKILQRSACPKHHYSVVTWASWHLKSPVPHPFVQQLAQTSTI